MKPSKKNLSNILTLLMTISMISFTYGQSQITVNGTVYDESGTTPLPGASVTVEGKSVGTTTDFDGNYSLEIQDTDVLVFSYIGFKTKQIPYGGQTTINITMEPDVQQLDDVVVVGFGTQSREVVTSAISKIKTEDIANSPAVHPVQALQGKVAGLSVNVDSGQPGSGAAIYIRGGTQANPREAANEPLYVIDGVFRDDLIGVSPNDIESIEVLKDAASTAIYGARAANGVIIVTTKSGKGVQGSNLQINYATGFDTRTREYDWTSPEDYIRISRLAAQQSINLGSPGARLTNNNFGYSVQELAETGEYGFERITLTYLDDLIGFEGQAYVDNLLANGYRTMVDPITGRNLIFLDNELDDARTRSGVTHDINISASGSSESGYYNVSTGYLSSEGTIVGTGSDRFTALLNGTYNLRDNLSVTGQFNYQYQDIDQPRSTNGTVNRSSRLPHTYRLWNDDGTPALGESTGSPRNIFHELFYQDDERQRFRSSYRMALDWEIIEGLHFKPSASIFRLESVDNFFERASREVTGRNMSRTQDTRNQLMFDGLLSYDRTFKERHNLNVLLGTQFVKERFDFFRGSGANAPTDIISTLNASETERERTFSFIENQRLLSFFGRLNYNFDKKYLFEFTLRRDGSSNFAANNRWAMFPSVSAGWNIHQENFWKSSLISRLKLRGSWGQAGNDNVFGSDVTRILDRVDPRGEFRTNSYGLTGGVELGNLPNSDLIWETTTQTNIAFDLGLMDNRFTVTTEFYDKVTSDRLISVPVPRQFGFGGIRSNFGSLTNTGVEVELGGSIVEKGDFSWDSYMNWSFNKARITELPDNENDKNRIGGFFVFDENGQETLVGGLAEGERPDGIWVYDMIGVYATDEEAANAPEDQISSGFYRNLYNDGKNGGDAIWRDINGDNIIDGRDRIRIGWRDPNVRGGFSNTFTYKGLSLRVVTDWSLGHTIDNNYLARSNGNARNNVMTHRNILGSGVWRQQGDIATIPRYDNASDFDNGPRNHVRPTTLYHQKGDYLAFREVSLRYRFPTDISAKMGMKETTLGIESYNLGYWTGYNGLTPEQFDGTDEGIYPRPFQIRLRLTATF